MDWIDITVKLNQDGLDRYNGKTKLGWIAKK